MHNKYFILHLTLIEDIGPAVIQKILLRSSAAKASEDFQQGYGGQVPERSDMQISDLYSFSQIDWMNTFGFTESIVEKLVTGLASTKLLEEELVLIERHNIQWATVQEEVYP